MNPRRPQGEALGHQYERREGVFGSIKKFMLSGVYQSEVLVVLLEHAALLLGDLVISFERQQSQSRQGDCDGREIFDRDHHPCREHTAGPE